MKTYFSTFISGTEKIVEKTLKQRKGKFEILYLLDGLVVYKTAYTQRDIRQIRFFNNSFILLSFYEKLSRDPLRGMMRTELNNKKLDGIIRSLFRKPTTFRVVTSLENQTVAANDVLLKKFEGKLVHYKNLSLQTRNPDVEFWFLARREGIGFFGVRFTFPNPKTPPLRKGELRHELAHILCLVSKPSPKDVVLDPFAGYGAVVLERAVAFPYKKIFAVDSDAELVKKLKNKVRKNGKSITITKDNAENLKEIPTASIDKIITDPPWGLYTKSDVSELYEKMLDEFYRVLKPNSIAVVLIGNKKAFEDVLGKQTKQWELSDQHDILVSGKKATIYKLSKR